MSDVYIVGAQVTSELAYPGRIVMRDEVASTLYENICPVTFLMNNTRKFASVIGPDRTWFFREALNSTERSILDDN